MAWLTRSVLPPLRDALTALDAMPLTFKNFAPWKQAHDALRHAVVTAKDVNELAEYFVRRAKEIADHQAMHPRPTAEKP